MGEYKTQSSNKNEIIINVLPYCHLLLHHGHVQISRIKNLNSIIMGLSSRIPFRYCFYTMFIINTLIFIIFHPLNIIRQSREPENTFIIRRCTFNLYGNITFGIWATQMFSNTIFLIFFHEISFCSVESDHIV